MRAHGREIEECLIVEGDWTVSSGGAGSLPAAGGLSDLDAVFASNDQMALGVLHAAHSLGSWFRTNSRGRRGRHSRSLHFWPPLTTVHQPLGDAGVLAVEDIDALIGKSKQARRSAETPPEMTFLEPV